ncbi:MAG TPA: YdcF family protein [Terriglobia bacterium]|nr:YdcF family protein [Terriglobia bacterium]
MKKQPQGTGRRFKRRTLLLVNFVLFMIPVAYFGYQPLLRYAAGLIIEDSEPRRSDAILLLAGGDPGRAWGAADLYKEQLGSYVILTAEPLGSDVIALRQAGIPIGTGVDQNERVLRALGVPQENIVRVKPYVQDTFDELTRVRELCEERQWKSLLIVTSNYHTRRTRLTAKYVLGPYMDFTVVASRHGGINPEAWWKMRNDVRTFLIEFEKLVAYIFYVGPRLLWTSQRNTNRSNTSSASPDSFSTFFS